MTTISYYWHSENTQKKKKICKANSNPPHSQVAKYYKDVVGPEVKDNESWMILEIMMITAELISLMFFQCSPELLKYHEQAPIKIFAEFKQFSFSSCSGFPDDTYQVFQLLFGGQNLGKVCKSTDNISTSICSSDFLLILSIILVMASIMICRLFGMLGSHSRHSSAV